MAHITLSIPDKVYGEMKKHPEIKWSEAARRGIVQQLVQVEGTIPGQDWLRTLPESTQKGLEQIKGLSRHSWELWHKKMRGREWKRANFSTRAS